MIFNRLIFPAIVAGLITVILLNHCYLLLAPLAFLSYRIISLKERVVIGLTLFSAVITLFICFNEQQLIAKQTVNLQQDVVGQTYLVMPDQIMINGPIVNARAVNCRTGRKVNLVYYGKNDRETERFAQIRSLSKWTVNGQIQPIEPATNFNQFESQRYYWQFHIYNQVKCKQVQVLLVNRANLFQKCHLIRANLYNYFNQLPHPLNGYCQQLILGMKNSQNDELMQNVKKLGLLHLFCISGMHVVLLTNCLRKLLVYCRFNREDIEWLLICALPFYLIIGGGSISLIRATIMAEMGLVQKLTHLSPLDGWALSLIGGLIYDPWLLFTLGGQLSYLLSFSLHVIPPEITGYRQSFLLNLIGLPSIISFVYELHVLTFVCSFIIIPIFSWFIFPAVIISAFLFKLFPGGVFLINHCLNIFERVLGTLSQFPGMISFGKPINVMTWILFCLTLLIIDHYRIKMLLILGGAYLITFTLIHIPLYGEVTFVDIGQGDSAIIRYPFSNRVELIDTGGKLIFGKQKSRTKNNYAVRTSINYLKSCGVKRIETIYLSHHDTDHIGYLTAYLQNFQIEKIAVPSGMEKQQALLKLIPADCQRLPQIIPVKAGCHFANSKLFVLHPFDKGKGNNEDSMVLAGTFGKMKFLFTGDLDRSGEEKLIQYYPNLQYDVLKLGHHGSRTSSKPSFIKKVDPTVGIISAGRRNRYGHPNKETIETLKSNNVKVISTQTRGMIRYRYIGTNSSWQTKLRGDEFQWMLPRSNNN